MYKKNNITLRVDNCCLFLLGDVQQPLLCLVKISKSNKRLFRIITKKQTAGVPQNTFCSYLKIYNR